MNHVLLILAATATGTVSDTEQVFNEHRLNWVSFFSQICKITLIILITFFFFLIVYLLYCVPPTKL